MKSSIAVVGMGRWGRNLVWVFNEVGPQQTVCDRDASREELALQNCLEALFCRGIEDVLSDQEISGIATVTSAATHADLVRGGLESGKDVFVGKPLALAVTEGEQLVALERDQAFFEGRGVMAACLRVQKPGISSRGRMDDERIIVGQKSRNNVRTYSRSD